MKAVILVADDVQDEEFLYPYYRLQEIFERKDILVISPDKMTVKGKYGIPFQCDNTSNILLTLPPAEILIIPGGWAPEKMRRDGLMLGYTQRMFKTGKVIGAICHGPQVLISARICQGLYMTAYQGIEDDVRNAGGLWCHDSVVMDTVHNVITAQHYRNNPMFMKWIIEQYYLRNAVIH